MTEQRTSPSISSLRALRYVALVAQLVTLLSVQWIWGTSPPWHIFGPLLGVLLLTNLLLPRLRGLLNSEDVIGGTIFLDVSLLTIGLASFGGPENPFTVLYLVQLTLVATMSTRRWTWLITIATSLGFRLLFWESVPLPHSLGGGGHMHHDPAAGGFNAHLQGMWVAFTIAAISIGAFVSRLTSSLREAKAREERAARLLGLAALAAGAAHEIGNPLGTIKIAAEELERSLEERSELSDLVEDAALICDEVERATDVLKRLASAAGELSGESITPVDVRALLDELAAQLDTTHARLIVTIQGELPEPLWPSEAVKQALTQLVRNALQASPPHRQVELGVRAHSDKITLWVSDQGHGMNAEVLSRQGEPFYTTRADGMGLGVFVARSLVEQLRGEYTVNSEESQGTTVMISLPMNVLKEVR